MTEPDDPAWLVLRERGEDVAHVPAATRASYDALTALFDELEVEAPSPGWKQRALAALDREAQQDSAALAPRDASAEWGSAPSRAGRRVRIWAAAGSVVSAAVLAVVIGLCGDGFDDRRARDGATQVRAATPANAEPAVIATPPPAATAGSRSPAAPRGGSVASAADARVTTEVRTEVRRGAQPHRGDSVSIGDTWILQVRAGDPAELRVYGDAGEPLARCVEDPRCTIERGGGFVRFRLELALRAPGAVRAVLFRGASVPASAAASAAASAPASVPAAFEGLDADVEAAQRAHVDARQIGIVHVQ